MRKELEKIIHDPNGHSDKPSEKPGDNPANDNEPCDSGDEIDQPNVNNNKPGDDELDDEELYAEILRLQKPKEIARFRAEIAEIEGDVYAASQ